MNPMKLWDGAIPFLDPEAETPNLLTPYLLEGDETRPCVVVFPGGGYQRRAPHEGEPIARAFNELGLHAVVVEYRVAPNRHPAPLADAQRAVRLVRANAKAWHVDPNRVVTCGFSAGGHLCASSVLFPDAYSASYPADAVDREDCRPNGAILCYPVISVTAEYGHVGSGQSLLGDRYAAEKEAFCLERRVTENTPPVFLWHTSDDNAVNVKNSLIFAERLRDCGVPFELHVFPHGKHGLGLASDFPDVRRWPALAAAWVLRNL
jgi:acetyl esterase/lipase